MNRFSSLTFTVAVAIVVAVVAGGAPRAHAHCQMPCGIYGDSMRFDTINESITTIEKAMNEITRLSKEKDVNYNQIVRWVNTKETHAGIIAEIVTDYFMTQRVKPSGEDDAAYLHKIALLHKMLVETMKTKQTTDLTHVKALRDLTAQFQDAYFSKEDKEHMKEHKMGMMEDKGGSMMQPGMMKEGEMKMEGSEHKH